MTSLHRRAKARRIGRGPKRKGHEPEAQGATKPKEREHCSYTSNALLGNKKGACGGCQPPSKRAPNQSSVTSTLTCSLTHPKSQNWKRGKTKYTVPRRRGGGSPHNPKRGVAAPSVRRAQGLAPRPGPEATYSSSPPKKGGRRAHTINTPVRDGWVSRANPKRLKHFQMECLKSAELTARLISSRKSA